MLDEASHHPSESFSRHLYSDRPDDFALLSTAAVGAYYLSPEVRELIGYPGQVPAPLSIDATPEYLNNGMLERVYDRCPGYRS